MKKANVSRKWVTVAAAFFVVALMTLVSTDAQAQKGAGAGALMGKPIETREDVDALKVGDQVAMACPKCKTITVTKVEDGKGSVKGTVVRDQHLCPGCGNEIKTTGVGKAATDKVVHVCKKCGSDMAFCCATSKAHHKE